MCLLVSLFVVGVRADSARRRDPDGWRRRSTLDEPAECPRAWHACTPQSSFEVASCSSALRAVWCRVWTARVRSKVRSVEGCTQRRARAVRVETAPRVRSAFKSIAFLP